MPLIGPVVQLTNLSLSVGSLDLFHGANAHIVSGQRVALVGPNGCGKSTLLRALAKQEGYFVIGSGRISHGLHAAEVLFIEQDALQWSTLIEGGTEEELRELTLAEALDLAISEGDEHAIEDAESWRQLNVAAHEVLEWRTAGYASTPLGKLSPGSAVRAYLAIALYRPNIKLLLLDEPTNHLDLPSVLWLQHTLISCGKSAVIVSHDADFMDAACDHLWVIDAHEKTLSVSGAKYTDYRAAERLAREQQAAAYEQQQQRRRQLTAVAEGLRAASAAGSRAVARDNDKLQRDFRRDRAGRSGKKAKAVEKLRDAAPAIERVVRRAPLHIDITPAGTPAGTAAAAAAAATGDVSLQACGAVLGHAPGRPLPLPPLSLRVDGGERVAVVGFNGAGKSTLLRTLVGALEPLEGSVRVGRDIRVGDLTQEHGDLPREEAARAYVAGAAGVSMADAGACLFRYGLKRAQVDSPISTLNPGARVRVLLAVFSLRRVNTLVLDEPTNHLDEEAVAEVAATVNGYAGTVVVVSHNREFLASLSLTRVLLLTAASGLAEIASVDEFVDRAEQSVADVVARVAR